MNWSRLPEISSSPLPESDCLLCMKVFQLGTVRDDCDFHWWRIWWWLTHIGSCNLLHAVSAGCICCSFKSIIIALPSTFPFEIKCVTLQRAHICSGPVAGLLSRPARMAIIGHLGQFNCSALSSGQKQQKKKKNKLNCVWGEKPLPYNSVRPFYSLFVCRSEKFLLSPCESAHNFLLFHFFFPQYNRIYCWPWLKQKK